MASAAPILVGVLYDFPQPDGGAGFEEAVRLGIDEVASAGRLDREIELVSRQARGLPGGTAHDVERNFAELVESGVLAVLGPSISDNGIVVRELADAAGVPCINYTGGEQTRSQFMFHYQVGSLQEEPPLLAAHLAAGGHDTTAVVHDQSPVGRTYAEFFEDAATRLGLGVVAKASLPPLVDDAAPVLARLRAAAPSALVYLGLGVAARAVAVALEKEGWDVPVVANSALMFGYAQREWRAAWDGWVYVDTVADDHPGRERLRARSPRAAGGPVGVAAYDMGRLLAEGIARCAHLTRAGLKDGLERVKGLEATSGHPGTTMGYGIWDRGALKGPFLVLREWRDGKTRQLP